MFGGKFRRFFQSHFLKSFVKSQHNKRLGQCKRCGKCCKILYKCPFLVELKDGSTQCKVYKKRPLQCRTYPITEKDLKNAGCKGFLFD